MKTFYVIRQGWNSANQSSMGVSRNPQNNFQSHFWQLVDVVFAADEADAIVKAQATVYNNQLLFAVKHPRKCKGLLEEIRQRECCFV
jgi:hypothetical protein